MNWARERWRKLCRTGRHTGATFWALLLYVQLVRYADDDGEYHHGNEPLEKHLGRTKGATPAERRIIPRAADELVRIGVLERGDGFVRLVADWEEIVRKRPHGGPMFRRLYLTEEAELVALPFFARGLAGALLGLAYDDGTIPFRAGERDGYFATRLFCRVHRDKTALGELLDALLACGYIEARGGAALGIRSFEASQGEARETVASGARTVREDSASGAPMDRDPSANSAPTVRERLANGAREAAQDPVIIQDSDQRSDPRDPSRSEGREGIGAPSRAAAPPGSGPSEPDEPAIPGYAAVVLEVRCLGGKTWRLTRAKLDDWQDAFPLPDLIGRLKRLRLKAERKRMPVGRVEAFLTACLDRELLDEREEQRQRELDEAERAARELARASRRAADASSPPSPAPLHWLDSPKSARDWLDDPANAGASLPTARNEQVWDDAVRDWARSHASEAPHPVWFAEWLEAHPRDPRPPAPSSDSPPN